MAILEIVTYPAEVLNQTARKVGRRDLEHARKLVRDMTETMLADGGIGLAANQVDQPLRIIVVRDLETDEINYYLNPSIVKGQGEEIDEEGCLSFPGMAGLIPRYETVAVKFQDLDLKSYKIELEGLAARTVQHEIDHLNGITIEDRSTVELYHRKEEEEETERPGKRHAVLN
jgi:peptide deformylase